MTSMFQAAFKRQGIGKVGRAARAQGQADLSKFLRMRSTNLNRRGFVRTDSASARFGVSARRIGLKPEKKFFDTAITFSFDTTMEASSTAATGGILLIPQGDTQSTRDGRQCVIKSVQVRGTLLFNPGAGAVGSTYAFMYMILDTQANGAYPAITDIFTSNMAELNMLNLNNSGRFRILKKWVMKFESKAGVTTAWEPVVRQIEHFEKMNLLVDYSGTAGAITEIRSNNIIFAFGSDGSTTGADDLVTLNGNVRVRFGG